MSEPQKEISASTVTSNRLFWLSLSEDLSVCSECFFFFFSGEQSNIDVKSQNQRKGFVPSYVQDALSREHCVASSPAMLRRNVQKDQGKRKKQSCRTRGLRKEDSILVMDHHEPCMGASISDTCSSIHLFLVWDLGFLGMTIAF